MEQSAAADHPTLHSLQEAFEVEAAGSGSSLDDSAHACPGRYGYKSHETPADASIA